MEEIYFIIEMIVWYVTGILYPALTHTARHEMGHVMEYYSHVVPHNERTKATIHLKKSCIIPFGIKLQSKLYNADIKKDIDVWMEEKAKCRGITEMPGNLPDEKAVRLVACGGAKNGLVNIIMYVAVTVVLQSIIRFIFVKGLHMSNTTPDMQVYAVGFTFLLWIPIEVISFLASGSKKAKGDLYYVLHPKDWLED